MKEFCLMIEIKSRVKLDVEEVRESIEDGLGVEILEILKLEDWS
jgi:hypothetical protein